MEKQGDPPSYEAALNNPNVNFIPTHNPGFTAASYPIPGGPVAPYPSAGVSAPYPTADGSSSYPYPVGSAVYPEAQGLIPPHHQTTGDFKVPAAPQGSVPPHTQTVTQVVVHHLPINFGDKSQPVTCPQCKQSVLSRTETEPSTQTHLCALLMCAFGIWPCCCLPYCMDSCQKINHYCPNCGVYLGSYQN